MKHENGANGDSPHGPACRVTNCLTGATGEVSKHSANACDRDRMSQKNEEPPTPSFQAKIKRIAQQVWHVPCVMKGAIKFFVPADNPADMAPKKVDKRRVWIGLLVAVPMM